jgi:hypothetical protein
MAVMTSCALLSICLAHALYVPHAQQMRPDAKPWVEATQSLIAPVLIDLPPTVPTPYVGEAIKTREGLDLFAAALMREVVEVEGAQVLVQSRAVELRPGTDRFPAFAQWLATEPEQVERNLVQGLVDARDISDLGRRTLARCIGHAPILLAKLAAAEQVQLRVAPTLEVSVSVTKDGVERTQRASLTTGRAWEEHDRFGQPEYADRAKPEPRHGSAIEPVEDGDLDFGEGQVTTLREAIEKARSLWKKRYRLDARLLDDWVFVKGKFTVERFDKCLERLGESLRFASFGPEDENPADLAIATRDRLFRAASEGLPAQARELFERAQNRVPFQVDAAELGRLDPKWARQLASMGVDGSAKVTITDRRISVLVWGDPMGGAWAPNSNVLPMTAFRF